MQVEPQESGLAFKREHRGGAGVRSAALTAALLAALSFGAGCAAQPDAAAGSQGDEAALSDVERLLAIEEIGRLKASYFRCLDTKDWACIATLFTPDATAVYNVEGSGGPATPDNPVTGNEGIAAFIQRAVEHLVTIHHGHMPEIEITSPTTATGIWAMLDILQEPGGENLVEGWGHYHETYERIDGRWYIKTLRLTRLRVDRAE